MSVLAVQRSPLHQLPKDPLLTILTFADAKDLQALRLTDKKIRSLSFSTLLLNLYLQTHFSCARSTTLPLPDQYDGLLRSRSRHLTASCTKQVKIGSPETFHSFGINGHGKILLSKAGSLILSNINNPTDLQLLPASENLWLFTMSAWADRALSVHSTTPSVKLWDLNSRECLATFEEPKPKRICATYLSEDGTKILLGFTYHSLKIIDVTTNAIQTISLSRRSRINELTMSPNKALTAIGYRNGFVDVFESETGKWVSALPHPACIDSLKLTQANKLITTDEVGKIKIWGNFPPIERPGDELPVNLQLSPDEKLALTFSNYGTINFLNTSNGALLKTLAIAPNYYKLAPISLDGTTLIAATENLEFNFIDLVPLPHEQIQEVVWAAWQNSPEAQKKFEALPDFVQEFVNTRYPPSNKEANQRIYEGLCQYSRATFLPGILEYFEKAKSAKSEECFAAAALRRVLTLPPDTQSLIYWKLSRLHQANGKSPPNGPENYGFLAFHDREGFSTTHNERIQVIQEIISSTTSVSQSSQKKRRPDS